MVACLGLEEEGSLVVVHHTREAEDHNREVVVDHSQLVVDVHSLEAVVHSQQVVVRSLVEVVHSLVVVAHSQLVVVHNQLVADHSQQVVREGVGVGVGGSLLVEVDHMLEVDDHRHPDEVEVPDVVVVRMACTQLVGHVEVAQVVAIYGRTPVLLAEVDSLLVVVHIQLEEAHVA